jgi:hypothetical protein
VLPKLHPRTGRQLSTEQIGKLMSKMIGLLMKL